ncbi:MAG: signal recognition particle-docking protein FtsY [Clostridia bacterium]|jgi:fused signal recognition particle receptor|nr:signal recognition particle-docking protein FtsY [Clostridiaceae bacterium]
MGFFEKLKKGLTKTKENLIGKIDNAIKSFTKIDEDLMDELEEILISADVGVSTSMELIDNLRESVRSKKMKDPKEVANELKELMKNILLEKKYEQKPEQEKPNVILVAGVNGAGKTTSIGKISKLLTSQGKKVVIAAGDTFRAAAIDQLEIWAKRAGADFVRQREGSDPAAVVYDAIVASKARSADYLICDTAGRLHNKKNLMMELNKIYRVIKRELPQSRVETFLVIDATTGQNAVNQAEVFSEAIDVDGIILTKLDGTAKGGIIFSIYKQLNIPVKYIGVGEQIDDLKDFDEEMFVNAMFAE